jgi:hypothetical protein
MTTITIAQHWVDELAELQPDSSTTNIADIVEAALQQYIFRQRQEKIARERRWYELHHHELFQQYAGQYVAIHNTQVIDADPDGRRLSRRMRQQHGRVAIAIIQVADSPEPPTLYLRSPKLAPA